MRTRIKSNKRTKTKSIIIALMSVVFVLFPILSLTAYADDATIVLSGTSGTCTWTIDSDGHMIIKPTSGTEGTLGTNWTPTTNHPWYQYGSRIKTVKFEGTIKATTTENMFSACRNLTSVDLQGLDTSKATDMSKMFYGCWSLREIDATLLDVSSATEEYDGIEGIFGDCRSLERLDVSQWNTSNIRNMSNAFGGCTSLKEIDVSSWDTSSAIHMASVFYDCPITEIDVSNWDTSNVTSMIRMFGRCRNLKEIDVSNWDTSNVSLAWEMFRECESLEKLDLSNWDTSSAKELNGMFMGCTSMTELDVSTWNTSNVRYMSHMFHGCTNLTELDVSTWNTSNVSLIGAMFNGCTSLTELDLSSWDTSKVREFDDIGLLDGYDYIGMFGGCESLKKITFGDDFVNTVYNLPAHFPLTMYSMPNNEDNPAAFTDADIIPDGANVYVIGKKVTFKPGEGIGTDGTQIFGYSLADKGLKSIDTLGFKAPDGKTFSGWNTKADGSGDFYDANQILNYDALLADLTLYAQWKKKNTPTPTEYTITYDLNGGEYNGSTEDITEKYEAGTNIKIHPAPTRDGYTFLYWKGSEYQPGDEYTVTEDHTFTAQWKKDAAADDPTDKDGKDNDQKSADTGDETYLISLLALLFASAGTLTAMIYRRKKAE